MLPDLRLALRALRKSPGFAFVAIATLALCIGANSAIFTVVNAVLLRPLPYPDAERLVVVYNSYPKSDLEYAGVSIPDYLDRMERAPSLEDGAIYTWESYNLATAREPVRILGVRASPSLFSTLQVQPVLGRAFAAAEAKPGQEHVVVISHDLWRDTFGSRESVLDDELRLDGESYRIIGVMPRHFAFPDPHVKVWVPFAFTPAQMTMDERGHEFSDMIARLRPGATAAALTAECEAIVQQNLQGAAQFRPYVEATGFTGIAKPMLEHSVADIAPMLWLLQAGVVAALLIGCANVANLLLTRALSRERELAIRTALGASRWSLIRQLLAETLVLFLLGGGLGYLVAMWGLSGMTALGLSELPRGQTVSLDLGTFVFTLACSSVTGLCFGLLPALQASRAQASDALKAAGTRVTAGRRQRLVRAVLVVSEVALSLMLLATTLLLTRSFHQLQQQSAGFDPESVITARINLPAHGYETDAARIAFSEAVLERIRSLPGVSHASLTSVLPFGQSNDQGTYHIAGREPPAGQPPPHGQIRSVASDYFPTLGVPLLQGRNFDAHDVADGAPVVIIDRVLADRYWPGESPIGQQIYRGANQTEDLHTIVGVVAAVKQHGLEDPVSKETLYFPFAQRPVERFSFTVRTKVAPESMTKALREAVQSIDGSLPLYDVQTMTGRIATSLQNRRTPMVLLSLFSGMALLLAALGVYGVLAFSVGQRTQEIGIRIALGAAARDVLGLILRQGLRLIGIGVALGIAGYAAVSRSLSHLVFAVDPFDLRAVVGAALLLSGIGLFAALVPARRAARVDPMVALRND